MTIIKFINELESLKYMMETIEDLEIDLKNYIKDMKEKTNMDISKNPFDEITLLMLKRWIFRKIK